MNKMVIKTHNLIKKFGDLVAVNNLNMEIKRGEIYGLIGPNGAGKTVTIKMLLGIMKPTRGSASIFGQKVPSIEIGTKIGYMPQESALYEDLTVHEHIHFFGEIYGVHSSQLREREDEILEFVGLAKWKKTIVLNLSGGMKSRLSLACSLIHQPELLFLDEPTVGIDPKLRISFWNYFRSITKKGTTILITTHYMDEANRCDRVGLMWNGRLIGEGSPDALRSKTGKESLEDVFLTLSEELNL